MTARYAVVGHPVAHSKSPLIHQAFATQLGRVLSYETIDAPPGDFAHVVRQFRQTGGAGLNVTVPYKQEAYALAEQVSPRAEQAGAVNTLAWADGPLTGDNTDGIGLLRDLTHNQRLTLAGRRLLVLGAGGAARGILGPLLEAGPAAVRLVNRTAQRARDLAALFRPLGPVAGGGWEDAAGEGAWDLIINATAASLEGQVPPVPARVVTDRTVCYDLAYADGPTVFLQWAQAAGAARVVDGLGMLVEQAAAAFVLWHGVRPDTAAVIEALRR